MIFFIQKMPVTSPDYFHYLPASPELAHWGLGVTAVGSLFAVAGAALGAAVGAMVRATSPAKKAAEKV